MRKKTAQTPPWEMTETTVELRPGNPDGIEVRVQMPNRFGVSHTTRTEKQALRWAQKYVEEKRAKDARANTVLSRYVVNDRGVLVPQPKEPIPAVVEGRGSQSSPFPPPPFIPGVRVR